MRKIFFLFAMLLTVQFLHAQFDYRAATVFKPKTFTAEDEITFTINVTGTPLEGKADLYLWIWSNEDAAGYTLINGITNGAWGASLPEAKMTNKGNNMFEYRFLPTSMFGVEPGKLLHFQFLIKTIDGSAKISEQNSPKFLFEPIVFIPLPFRVFPNRLGASDVTTVYFHQDLAPTVAEQRMTPKTVTVKLYDETNTQIGDTKTWNLKAEGNKVWSYSFIPNIVWTIPAGKTAAKFSYRFDGAGKDINGKDVSVTGTTTEKNIDALQ